jgi:hypothetical protein
MRARGAPQVEKGAPFFFFINPEFFTLLVFLLNMAAERERVWIDCDPGHDDAFALILAGHSPSLEVVGVSTSAGNQTLDKTTKNVRPRLHVACSSSHSPHRPTAAFFKFLYRRSMYYTRPVLRTFPCTAASISR